MSRIALLSVAFFSLSVLAVVPNAQAEDDVVEPKEIDPIITGQTVNGDYMEEWESLREKYLECGKCAIAPQPYPGD